MFTVLKVIKALQRLLPIILATQEAKTRRITVRGHLNRKRWVWWHALSIPVLWEA
jgi:hypothetical protein